MRSQGGRNNAQDDDGSAAPDWGGQRGLGRVELGFGARVLLEQALLALEGDLGLPEQRFLRLQLRLQQVGGGALPYQVYLMLPYLLSILALVLMARRAAYPQALMKPYRKGER